MVRRTTVQSVMYGITESRVGQKNSTEKRYKDSTPKKKSRSGSGGAASETPTQQNGAGGVDYLSILTTAAKARKCLKKLSDQKKKGRPESIL